MPRCSWPSLAMLVIISPWISIILEVQGALDDVLELERLIQRGAVSRKADARYVRTSARSYLPEVASFSTSFSAAGLFDSNSAKGSGLLSPGGQAEV
ncbi:hypothetical protein NMY22_g15695 [Coprinellus aureogranulatus]|nr:hypothetical protein NMY22_g15695 [Coprinellus aureogranulatus]